MSRFLPSIAALAGALALAATASAADLTVTLEGVEARGGPLYISLQTEDQFMKEEAIAGDRTEAPQAGNLTYTLSVPAGKYALVVWHDDNGNGEFDRQEDGQPLDGWAMSHSADLRGFPTFAAVSVDVPESGAAITEPMIYGR